MKADRPYRKPNIPDSAQRVFEGDIFDTYQWEQELFDGSKKIFERVVRPDTVVLYPVLENGDVLLIEDSQPAQPTYLCGPSGKVDTGETPEQAARRELLEETGHEFSELVPLYVETPHIKLDWTIYGYIAKNCKKTRDAKPEPGERILLRPVAFEDFLTLASDDKIYDPRLTVMVLQARLDKSKMAELRKKFLS